MSTAPEQLRRQVQEEQHGKQYHGKLVLTSLYILTEFYDRYNSIQECYKNTNIEARGTDLHCDILDIENKFIVECGFIEGFSEAWPTFLEKAVSYAMPPGEIWEEAPKYTFLHVPKSFYRDASEFSEPDAILGLQKQHFIELTFTDEYVGKAKSYHDQQMEELQDEVDRVW